MKEILVLTLTFLMTVNIAFADMFIAPDALPENVKNFIKKNFIMLVLCMPKQTIYKPFL